MLLLLLLFLQKIGVGRAREVSEEGSIWDRRLDYIDSSNSVTFVGEKREKKRRRRKEKKKEKKKSNLRLIYLIIIVNEK